MDYITLSPMRRSAEISDCGSYRWWLRREWTCYRNGIAQPGEGVCCFVMLNPSKADGEIDDPTIRRCIGFAQKWHYHTLSVRNLFPWRATDPRELFHGLTVAGGARGDSELLAALTADLVVLAWGANVPFNRDREALKIFRDAAPAKPLWCLGKTKAGNPRHPVRLASDTLLQRFEE